MSAALSFRWYAFSAVVALLAASFGFLGSESAQARPSAAHPARPASRGVVVSYPGPGWRTVSPSTTITFRGTPAPKLGSVRVVGSSSGLHRGRLVGASDGEGATFHPDKPFRPGEQVSVTSAVRVVGSTSNRFSFTVKTPAGQDPQPLPDTDGQGVGAGRKTLRASGGGAVRKSAAVVRCRAVRPSYHSRPELHPHGACISHAPDHVQPGLLMTTPHATDKIHQHGPTIYDNRGNVVWYQPMPYVRTWNLSVVTYQGQRMLAVYVQHPRHPNGVDDWEYLLLNRHYQTVAKIRAHNGYFADLHEFQLTPDGKALIGAYNRVTDPVSGHLTTEYVVQEIDVASDQLLFEWHSLDHVSTAESYYPEPTGSNTWDYFHGNAISQLADGSLLVSGRNTSTVYDISTQPDDDGAVVWRLGGKLDDFHVVSDHPDWQFCFQHDVRNLGPGVLSVFDNGGDGPVCPRHPARVEKITYDTGSMTAQGATSYSSTTASPNGVGYFAHALGNGQQLANGGWLASWGMVPHITEFGPDGKVKFDMTLSFRTYRAVRRAWTGEPLGLPALAAQRDKGVVTAWMSWNGSTRLGAWRLLAGTSPSHLHVVKQIGRTGFETRVRARTSDRYVAVQAMDHHGHVLSQSLARRPS